MRFVTLIPLQVWVIALALGVVSYFFGLPGFVSLAIILLFLAV